MTIEQILEINNVKKVTAKPDTPVAQKVNDVYIDKLGSLVANDILLVKDHVMPTIGRYVDIMEQAKRTIDATHTEQEPKIVFLDVPKHIEIISNVDGYTKLPFTLSDFETLSIPWEDSYYTTIFSQDVKPHESLYRDYKKYVSQDQVKRVWVKYIEGTSELNVINAFSSIFQARTATYNTLNDIYILDILLKNIARYGGTTATIDNVTKLTVNGMAIVNNEILRRIDICNSETLNEYTVLRIIIEDGVNNIVTTKALVQTFVLSGGDIDTLKHNHFNNGVVKSNTVLISEAEDLKIAYVEHFNTLKLKNEQGNRGRLVGMYVQGMTSLLNEKYNEGTKLSYNNDTYIEETLNVIEGLDFYDVFDINRTCMKIVLEVLAKSTNSEMVISYISKYTKKGLDINTATTFAIEDLLVKYITSKMLVIE